MLIAINMMFAEECLDKGVRKKETMFEARKDCNDRTRLA